MSAWSVSVGTVNLDKSTYQLEVFDNLEHPTKLSDWVRPGDVLSNDHHASYISECKPGDYNCIKQLSSTIGVVKRRLFNGYMYLENAPGSCKFPGRGIVAWKWPVNCNGVWKLVKDTDMPGYSDQQKHITNASCQQTAGMEFMDLVQSLKRDPHAHLSDLERQQMVGNIQEMLKGRVELVKKAQTIPKEKQAAENDNYSTPELDKTFLTKLNKLYKITDEVGGPGARASLDRDLSVIPSTDRNRRQYDPPFDIGNGKLMTAYQFSELISKKDNTISSKPWDSLDDRWGIPKDVPALIQKKEAERNEQVKLVTSIQPKDMSKVFDEHHQPTPAALNDPQTMRWFTESNKLGLMMDDMKVISSWLPK